MKARLLYTLVHYIFSSKENETCVFHVNVCILFATTVSFFYTRLLTDIGTRRK